jgi:NADH dehydrogenase
LSKKIVILGAGYAGVEAALTLQKKKRESDNIEILLIDKNSYHTLMTELHQVAGNRISEDGAIVPLRDIFKYTDVKLIKDEIVTIDFEGNRLASKTAEYGFDYLIIAGGSEPNYYGIPGLKENSFPLWSLKDAENIREHIKECFWAASQEEDQERVSSLLTFVVGGGGFTGVEVMGEVAHWVKSLCREYGISRTKVRLVLVEALPNILSILDPKSIAKVVNYLTDTLKVEILRNSAITRLNPDSVELKSGRKISTNTLIWTAGIKASCVTDDINDAMKGKGCRIIVDEYTRTKYPNVYAAGDIAAFMTKDGLLPDLVEAAVQTAKTAAKNILADIRNKQKRALEPKLHGVMISVGGHFAVADIMGYKLPRCLAIWMKHLVNIHYLFGIGGFELISKYIKHEFLYNRQGFVTGRNYSAKILALWVIPLRLFLGYSWLTEGVGKIKEGWLLKPLLAGMATDANSSASVTDTGEKVFRIISENTPQWYAWIVNHLVIPNALIFQIIIVLTEIGLGLAFITGTFSFIAGLVSLGLILNFTLSTGFQESNWWFITGAICMMGGAGRAYGVDHYLIPYLMRLWRYYIRNNKIKLLLFH